jgi:aspartyl-tRNA(Asn)/glutamyl-tRNA(Gln) amidotransferase subunit C
MGIRFAFAAEAGLNFHFKNMALTTDSVRQIAALARLRLTPDEERRFGEQLGKVVDYIDQLQQFEETKGSEPAPGSLPPIVPPGHQAEDHARPGLPREVFLANAPAALDAFLLVPEVKGGGAGE